MLVKGVTGDTDFISVIGGLKHTRFVAYTQVKRICCGLDKIGRIRQKGNWVVILYQLSFSIAF